MPVSWRLASLMVVTLEETAAMALTVCSTAPWISRICAPMSPVALAVCCASDFTSPATTAKPRPAAPARAASMVALSAKSEVWAAIDSISFTTMPMRSAAAARLRTVRSVRARSSTVRSVASLAAATSTPERAISARRSRAAVPTASTLRAASAAASAAEVVRSRMSLLRAPRSAAVTRISSPDLSNAEIISLMAERNCWVMKVWPARWSLDSETRLRCATASASASINDWRIRSAAAAISPIGPPPIRSGRAA